MSPTHIITLNYFEKLQVMQILKDKEFKNIPYYNVVLTLRVSISWSVYWNVRNDKYTYVSIFTV